MNPRSCSPAHKFHRPATDFDLVCHVESWRLRGSEGKSRLVDQRTLSFALIRFRSRLDMEIRDGVPAKPPPWSCKITGPIARDSRRRPTGTVQRVGPFPTAHLPHISAQAAMVGTIQSTSPPSTSALRVLSVAWLLAWALGSKDDAPWVVGVPRPGDIGMSSNPDTVLGEIRWSPSMKNRKRHGFGHRYQAADLPPR